MKNEFILNVSEIIPDRPSNASRERTCEECGRQFFSSSQWAYRFDVKGHTYWFCRYNCHRAGEKKLEAQIAESRSKAGRKQELKSKKPSKEVLEKDLRAGLTIAVIAKKHETSVQSVHNWIRSYGLAGIQGVKKPVDEVAVELAQDAGHDAEIVQESPTLAEIEQFHTDEAVQELPIVEMNLPGMTEEENMTDEEFDQIMSTVGVQPITAKLDPVVEETLDGIWQGVADCLALAKIKYAEQTDKEFRAHLLSLVLAVTNGRGI